MGKPRMLQIDKRGIGDSQFRQFSKDFRAFRTGWLRLTEAREVTLYGWPGYRRQFSAVLPFCISSLRI